MKITRRAFVKGIIGLGGALALPYMKFMDPKSVAERDFFVEHQRN